MSVYLISYDLHKPKIGYRNYKPVINAIKALGNSWHCQYSTWIVETEDTARKIRNWVRTVMIKQDRLLIVKLASPINLSGFKRQQIAWLRKGLK